MGLLTLASLFTLETFFLVWAIRTRNHHRQERAIVSLSTLALFVLLLATGVYAWSFRYTMLLLLLVIQALAGVVVLARKRVQPYRKGRTVPIFVKNGIIITLALSPALIFPQYVQPIPTGSYEVGTGKYTWTDPNRSDYFSKSGKNRALTVEFWYPEHVEEKYPLVVFSHGAFGFSGSNHSTFVDLASHGYVVASISHTHHALYTIDTTGKLTTADPFFISNAMKVNAATDTGDEEELFTITQGWMKLRTEDGHFVLDTILALSQTPGSGKPFSLIDKERIGLIGHSLGGASSALLGRERTDIEAVIVLDGTMLGEEIAFGNNTVILNDTPYPVPLLNVYAEDHHTNAKRLRGDAYDNFHATNGAILAYETVFKRSGHLNFTDLPLFSPLFAKMLGVGTIDAWYCINTMNSVVLEFFNSFLQNSGEPNIAKEY